ncbi:hypothetical protein D030_5091A, partial [Vibrio parahaemolyticus AQ3810]
MHELEPHHLGQEKPLLGYLDREIACLRVVQEY